MTRLLGQSLDTFQRRHDLRRRSPQGQTIIQEDRPRTTLQDTLSLLIHGQEGVRIGQKEDAVLPQRQIFFPLPGSPSSLHIASTLSMTACSMRIWRPHSRLVSPGNLSVASKPIFEPRPDTGLAKSR